MNSSNDHADIIQLELLNEAYRSHKDSPLIRSPLIPLNVTVERKKVYLKCENLQPFGSFKARGACFAMRKLTDAQKSAGVCTASAGNFAQGLGFMAKEYGCPCTVLVPETIPQTKLDRILSLGADVKKVAFDEWWSSMVNRRLDSSHGATFIHALDEHVIAGHGTIGLEILEDLPEVDTVICPFGSGGLITGVASAVKHLKPDCKVIACEPEVATPLKYSLAQGKPSILPEHRPSFVDGMGGKQVMERIWPYVCRLVDGTVTVTLEQIVDAMRMLIDSASLVVEGAGAAPLSAALTDEVPDGNIVCVLSGGNIDFNQLEAVCKNQIPRPAGQ